MLVADLVKGEGEGSQGGTVQGREEVRGFNGDEWRVLDAHLEGFLVGYSVVDLVALLVLWGVGGCQTLHLDIAEGEIKGVLEDLGSLQFLLLVQSVLVGLGDDFPLDEGTVPLEGQSFPVHFFNQLLLFLSIFFFLSEELAQANDFWVVVDARLFSLVSGSLQLVVDCFSLWRVAHQLFLGNLKGLCREMS